MKKNLFYFLSTTILSSGLGFVVAIYMSHVLSPVEFGYIGIFGMILYIVEPMIAFFSFGLLEINLVTYSPVKYRVFKNKLINFGFFNFILIVIIIFCTSIIVSKYKSLLFFIPFLALSRFFLKIKWIELIQNKEAKKYAFFYSLFSIMMLILTITMISGFDLSWDGRLWAMLIAEYFFVWIFFKNYHFKKYFFKKKELIEVLKFGAPIFIGLGAAWLLQESDKFIVLKYFDMSIVGIYTFSYLIGRVLQIVNQAIIKTLRPIYYQKLHHGKMMIKYHIKVVSLYALVSLVLATVLAVILGQIKYILLPEDYRSGSEIIIIIFYAFAIFGVYQIVSLILEFYKKNIQKMIFFYVAATVNIVFSILLIDEFGMLAPAYGTLIGFVILALMSFVYSISVLKNYK